MITKNMLRLIGVLIFVISIWLPAFVYAEFYRYTDENGVLHYTDNLVEVPVNQRKNVKQYKEEVEVLATEEKLPGAEKATKNKSLPFQGDPQAQTLLKTKAKLDKEYAELTKEREKLESETGVFSTSEDFDKEEYGEYKERVARFNERKSDYEERVKVFEEIAGAFNKKQATKTDKAVKKPILSGVANKANNTETQAPKGSVAESIIKTNANFDKEYADLMKEREALVSETDIFSTTEKFEAYKERVARFNERSADYMKRAKAFQEKAEAHNKAQAQ